jgi:hypothetical protein
MKKCFLLFSLAILAVTVRGADIIAQWNFNGSVNDTNTSTGSTNASIGSGSLRVFGGAVYSFAGGHTNDPTPATNDNSAINVSTYSTSTSSNKQVGIRFTVNTAAYTNLAITWSQRESATGSRYHRLQYSTDGTTFADMPAAFAIVYTNNQTATLIFTNLSQDLSAIPGVADNPNFAFQIVYETEISATGSGSSGYIAAANGSTFGSAGTVRFEMMTVSGTAIGIPNTPPTISSIANVTMRADSTNPPIPFVIGDAETPAASLTLNKASSDLALFPLSSIALGGSGSSRTVTLTPTPNTTGSATITLSVIDEGGKSNNSIFVVTVIPTNTPPSISAILNQGTLVNTPTPAIAFTISDAELAASNLTVTAVSSNTTVLPQVGVVLGGSESNRTVTLTPASGQVGNALVSITVSDGVLTTNRTFVLSVLPSTGTLLYEPFNYADGPLVTNSLGLWQTHSGTSGQLDTESQVLFVTADNNEDVSARLRGEPYTPASGTNLYYSFRFSAFNLPTPLGDYFAHLKDNGNNFRGRFFVSTTNAALFSYRIGVGNGIGFPTNAGYAEITQDLALDTTYTIVVRYNVGTGLTTLWLNPVNESSPSVTATDVLGSTNSMTQFAIRESSFQGDIYVDDVRVTTTFGEALGILPPPSVSLRIFRSGGDVVISWPSPSSGYVLQSTLSLSPTNWQDVAQTPVVVGNEKFVTNSSPTGNAFFRLKN